MILILLLHKKIHSNLVYIYKNTGCSMAEWYIQNRKKRYKNKLNCIKWYTNIITRVHHLWFHSQFSKKLWTLSSQALELQKVKILCRVFWGPILTFVDSTNGGSKGPLWIMTGVCSPPLKGKNILNHIFPMIYGG